MAINWRCSFPLTFVMTVVIVCVITPSALADDGDLPFMSQFPKDDIQSDLSRPVNGGDTFQYLHIAWIRQEQLADARVVSLLVHCQPLRQPSVTWIVNGGMVTEHDQSQYPQTAHYDPEGMFESITIPNDLDVTSLQVLVALETIETETVIQLQSLDTGKVILEYGTDVALALDLQENVTATHDSDLVFTARFFAEDLPESNYDGLHVELFQGQDVLTPDRDPEVMTLNDVTTEDPYFKGLRRLSTLNLAGNNKAGTLVFRAGYSSNFGCRLFGGKTIRRKVFITQSYW